jgi:hypothetical protein
LIDINFPQAAMEDWRSPAPAAGQEHEQDNFFANTVDALLRSCDVCISASAASR